jgi:hypothetical protein
MVRGDAAGVGQPREVLDRSGLGGELTHRTAANRLEVEMMLNRPGEGPAVGREHPEGIPETDGTELPGGGDVLEVNRSG